MATERKKSSSSKTTSARSKKASPQNKRAPAKNTRSSAAPAISAEAVKQKNQIRSIIMFAFAILFFCFVLIPGDNLWNWAHNVILGIFGGFAIVWPFLIIYVAVVTALNKPRGSVSGKIWLTTAVICLLCTTGFVFGGISAPEDLGFFEYIAYLYTDNSGIGGGVVGGLLGTLLLNAVGSLGSKIIVILLLFVSIMLLTGTTLIGLFKTIKKPVDVVSEGIQNAKQRREEEDLILEQEEKEAEIDISLDDELPAHPAQSDPSQLFPKPKREQKKSNQENEKLSKLKQVFGIGSSNEESKPEQNEDDPAKELKNAVNEIPDISFSENINSDSSSDMPENVHTSEPEPFARADAENGDTHVDTDENIPEDVKELTEEFMKQREESKRQEATDHQKALYMAADQMQNTYCYPPVSMLAESAQTNPALESEELQANGKILVDTLKSFGVQTKILDICRGPSVTRYEIQPASGVKISKITNLADDLALNLAATGVRIEAPIPGKAAVGIEIPNKTRSTVRMRELIESSAFQNSESKVSVALGRDIAGQPVVMDLAKMPHLLIAGTTGSGKSVCINSIIISMLYKASPDDVRFLMIDPKAVELTDYNGVPHMLVPVVTDPRKASGALNWAVSEMMKRYKIFSEFNVRNLKGYNSLAESRNFEDENGQPMPGMPQIVIIIDELADLMMAAPKEVEDSICRLAQLARAAGMHLVVATQRPSVDVVTGLIKANIPSRIALTVSNFVDSKTILDSGGAEKLLGNGDMLCAPVWVQKPVRVQGCYVSDGEINSIVEFVKKSKSIDYDESVIDEIERNAAGESAEADHGGGDDSGSTDPMLNEAIKCVVEAGQASTSLLQRRLRLGYARAGRLVDEMEQLGVVGPHEGSKPRQVLITYTQWLEMNMQKSDEAEKTD